MPQNAHGGGVVNDVVVGEQDDLWTADGKWCVGNVLEVHGKTGPRRPLFLLSLPRSSETGSYGGCENFDDRGEEWVGVGGGSEVAAKEVEAPQGGSGGKGGGRGHF